MPRASKYVMLFLLSAKFKKDSTTSERMVEVFQGCRSLGCDVSVTFDRGSDGINLMAMASSTTKDEAYQIFTNARFSVEVL